MLNSLHHKMLRDLFVKFTDGFETRLVPLTRLERVAYGLGNRRSIHLSYGGTEKQG